jgi:hypothetical protein
MSIPIVWGTRMMGKVDAVPGVGHVATKFFYLQYVPLIPVETYLVFQEVGEEIHGVRIPFSPKSIFIAWLRAGCVVAALGLLIAGVVANSERHHAAGAICVLGAALLVGAFFYSYSFGPICRAGYDRAMQLARLANLGPEQFLALEISFGRMNADQAELELVRIYEQAQAAHEKELAQEPPSPDHLSSSRPLLASHREGK